MTKEVEQALILAQAALNPLSGFLRKGSPKAQRHLESVREAIRLALSQAAKMSLLGPPRPVPAGTPFPLNRTRTLEYMTKFCQRCQKPLAPLHVAARQGRVLCWQCDPGEPPAA